MKVAGVYPQTTTANNIAARSTYGEPLGLGKVLSLAKAAGCHVAYEMPIDESVDSLISRIEAFDPDLVAFSAMTCQMPLASKIAGEIKRARKDRIVLAGGYHPSAMSSLEGPFDAFVVGEGEIPFQSIIQSLEHGRDWRRAPGLLLPNDRTEAPKRIEHLDHYPWALREPRILKQTYFGLVYPPPSQQTAFASVEYGRGCKWNCIYCCKQVIWNNTLVYRDPDDVVREMRSLRDHHSVNLFFFTDLNFTSVPDRVLSLCQAMRRGRLHTPWFCMSNIATASSPVLEAMAEAGCVKVMYGIESVDDATLRLIKKGGTYDAERKVLRDTFDLGIVPHLFYMVGFPWETTGAISTALTRLCDLPGLQLRIGIATPLPGSNWYWQMRPRLTEGDQSRYDCEHLVFRHDQMSPSKIQEAVKHLYEGFYQTEAYARRVEEFLRRWPKYEHSFEEFFGVMAASGYRPPNILGKGSLQ